MKRILLFFVCMLLAFSITAHAQQKFNGLDVGLNNLFRLSDAKSRSISPENFTGAKGEGGKATMGTGSAGFERSRTRMEDESERGHQSKNNIYNGRDQRHLVRYNISG